MDSNIMWVMLATVGVTEIVKKFCPKLIGKLALAATIIIACGISAFYLFCNDYWNTIRVALVAISGSVVFYDTVFKLFKNLITKFGANNEGSTNTN